MKIMQRSLKFMVFAAVVIATPAWPLTIASPRAGEQVKPGQTMWLIVQASSSAETNVQTVQVLAPGAKGCEDVLPASPIQCQLTIPDGSDDAVIPTAVDIRVHVTYINGLEGSASTQVNVVMPTEALSALQGDPRDSPLVFDAVGQEKNLSVMGLSLDGTTLDLRGRDKGTVYDINNPAVVKVREDGRVVAQRMGKATITVRNGALFFEVPVIVRAPDTSK